MSYLEEDAEIVTFKAVVTQNLIQKITPSKANKNDAGIDLRSLENVVLKPFERKTIRTGITVDLPSNSVGLICPKSGLASKHGISVLNSPGIVDSGYTGEIKIILMNFSNEEYTFKAGDKAAQMLVISLTNYHIVFDNQTISSNKLRDENGFGSSGK